MKILSSLPGRLRVSHPNLKSSRTMAHITHCIEQLDGIRQVEGQTITGSILIHYDHHALQELELMQEVFGDFRASYKAPREAKKKKGFRLHKSNKLWRTSLHGGMIGSLAICTYTGFEGPKKLHVKAGLAFLAVTAEHMRINSRLLFR